MENNSNKKKSTFELYLEKLRREHEKSVKRREELFKQQEEEKKLSHKKEEDKEYIMTNSDEFINEFMNDIDEGKFEYDLEPCCEKTDINDEYIEKRLENYNNLLKSDIFKMLDELDDENDKKSFKLEYIQKRKKN